MDGVGARGVRVGKAPELMRQHEVELLVLLELIMRGVLQVASRGELLVERRSVQHLASMVAPRLLVESIVEVLVHILLAIVVPGLGVGVEVVPVDLRDGELL